MPHGRATAARTYSRTTFPPSSGSRRIWAAKSLHLHGFVEMHRQRHILNVGGRTCVGQVKGDPAVVLDDFHFFRLDGGNVFNLPMLFERTPDGAWVRIVALELGCGGVHAASALHVIEVERYQSQSSIADE